MDDESEAYRVNSTQGSGEVLQYLDPSEIQNQHLEQYGLGIDLGNDFNVPRKVK